MTTSRSTSQRRPHHWLVHWLRTSDLSLIAGRIAVWIAVLTFGGIFWAINGGFSVAGLEVIATSFNAGGRLFWAAISSWAFALPFAVPGLPATQPIAPWIGVSAASVLQVVVLYRKLRGLPIPVELAIAAFLLSCYDLTTTFFGLSIVGWMAGAGIIVQGLLAFILTFIVELTIGLLLKPSKKVERDDDE